MNAELMSSRNFLGRQVHVVAGLKRAPLRRPRPTVFVDDVKSQDAPHVTAPCCLSSPVALTVRDYARSASKRLAAKSSASLEAP